MKRLTRDHLFKNYPPYSMPEEPPLRVEQGESFLIETVDTADMWVMSPEDTWVVADGRSRCGLFATASDDASLRIEDSPHV